MRGFKPNLLEVLSDHRGDTFRAVYTVRFADDVYVLHVFQKKSKTGIATPQREMEVVRERLKWAERLPRPKGDAVMAGKKNHVIGTGNVFADLGVTRPEEALAKAQLAPPGHLDHRAPTTHTS